MKLRCAVPALVLACLSLPFTPATAAPAQTATPILRRWPPIVHFPISNPHHYVLLDATSAVVTSLDEWTPAALPGNVTCYPFGDPGLFCMSNDYSPFAVDLGGGVDLGSILDVKTKSVSSTEIAAIAFDSGAAGTSFLHLTGFLDTPTESNVTANVQGTFASAASIVNNHIYYSDSTTPYGAVALALQTQDEANNWNDVGVSYLPPTFIHGGESTTVTMSVKARIPAGTGVRTELRVGTAFQSQSGGFTVLGGAMVVPKCLPDPANPGGCL